MNPGPSFDTVIADTWDHVPLSLARGRRTGSRSAVSASAAAMPQPATSRRRSTGTSSPDFTIQRWHLHSRPALMARAACYPGSPSRRSSWSAGADRAHLDQYFTESARTPAAARPAAAEASPLAPARARGPRKHRSARGRGSSTRPPAVRKDPGACACLRPDTRLQLGAHRWPVAAALRGRGEHSSPLYARGSDRREARLSANVASSIPSFLACLPRCSPAGNFAKATARYSTACWSQLHRLGLCDHD